MNVAAFAAIEGGRPAASRPAKTYRRAMAFAPERAASLAIAPEAMGAAAAEEAAGGRIVLDAQGLTPGLRQHVVRPARALLAEWRTLRDEFEASLAPKRAAIDAADDLDAGIASLRHAARDQLAGAVASWRLIERNKAVERDWQEARSVHAACCARNGGRVVNRLAHLPVYAAAPLLIAGLYAVVNGDAFAALAHRPAIAPSLAHFATIVAAVLLAFAAHAHGVLAKQWRVRFAGDGPAALRRASRRLAALATLAAAASLAAAAAATGLAGLAAADGPPWGAIALNLLGNAAIWRLGLGIARFCHDPDPQFMQADRRHRRVGRRYRAACNEMHGQMKALEARSTRQIMAMQVEKLAKEALVARERAQLAQIQAREAAIFRAVLAAAQRNFEQYRQALAHRIARARDDAAKRGLPPQPALLAGPAGEQEVSPVAWLSMDLRIEPGMLTEPAAEAVRAVPRRSVQPLAAPPRFE